MDGHKSGQRSKRDCQVKSQTLYNISYFSTTESYKTSINSRIKTSFETFYISYLTLVKALYNITLNTAIFYSITLLYSLWLQNKYLHDKVIFIVLFRVR